MSDLIAFTLVLWSLSMLTVLIFIAAYTHLAKQVEKDLEFYKSIWGDGATPGFEHEYEHAMHQISILLKKSAELRESRNIAEKFLTDLILWGFATLVVLACLVLP